jgi:Spy/CpxP family protein refolding chaperone
MSSRAEMSAAVPRPGRRGLGGARGTRVAPLVAERRQAVMTTSRIVVVAALAAVLGLVAALRIERDLAKEAVAPQPYTPAPIQPRSSAPKASALAQLGLDERQREQIDRLGVRERRSIEELERALAATERNLRTAELAQPFDAEYVNQLVAQRAELAAHLRGTESRVVSEIAAMLTPEQQRHFLELRLSGAAAAPRTLEAPPAARVRGESPGI